MTLKGPDHLKRNAALSVGRGKVRAAGFADAGGGALPLSQPFPTRGEGFNDFASCAVGRLLSQRLSLTARAASLTLQNPDHLK